MKGRYSARGISGRIALACFGALIALLCAEGGLRVLRGKAIAERRAEMASRRALAQQRLESDDVLVPFAGHPYAELHPYYGYTLKPGFDGTAQLSRPTRFAVDKYGFRNGPIDYREIPDDRLVIGVFGGSCVFGDGVQGNENTVAGRMEARLRSALGPKVHVLNFGVPGWHYPQQFFALVRALDRLDAAVVCDGLNDILVPYWNMTQTADGPLPPDYPSGFTPRVFSPAVSPDMAELALRLLRFDAAYSPSSWLGRSALYTWIRYKRLLRLQALADATAHRVRRASPAQPRDNLPDPLRLDRATAFGIREWTEYAARTDAVAATRSVPVLHVLQPFLYARAEIPVDFDRLPDVAWVHDMFRLRHPSAWWQELRRAAREWAEAAKSDGAAPGAPTDFMDLSEAVSPDPANWLDCAHLSPAGCDRLAAVLCDRLIQNGTIRGETAEISE